MMLPAQRWRIAPPDPERARTLAQHFKLSPVLGQVLLNRGYGDMAAAKLFFEPDAWTLPDPSTVFADLRPCVERLAKAITHQEKIAICGDYDCDGMTSTALLIRAFRTLGAHHVRYEIPNRLEEGYGINGRMVQELADANYTVLITVDNGISALKPLLLAAELGVDVIITDHHDLPPDLPPALGILNPKLIPAHSPYHSLAGVGMAYILALALADYMKAGAELRDELLALFTLGTVADMAPLVGVNRLWVQKGLAMLPFTQNPGIRALMMVSGFTDLKTLKPEAIGFGIGPRINAVGRIADPELVVTLLTTDDPEEALARAQACEQTNKQRQALLAQMEQEALELVAEQGLDLTQVRVLTVAKAGWHHGVVGLVASRLKEKLGCPCFVGVLEEESVRGSARGIPEFNIFESLTYCREVLGNFGGHPMAGGFGCTPQQWPLFQAKVQEFAQQILEPSHIRPLVDVDAEVSLGELSFDLLQQMDRFHPCGIQNPDPIFWSAQVRILQQKPMGKQQEHLRLTITDGKSELEVVAWRWGAYAPLPEYVDIAFKLQENTYQGRSKLQLDLQGLRTVTAAPPTLVIPTPEHPKQAPFTKPNSKDPLDYVVTVAATGKTLLYGFDRPEFPLLPITYDRPQKDQTYEHLIFWTLPPSPLHYQWLSSHCQPQQVHLLLQPVRYPTWEELLTLMQTQLTETTIPLLRLSQTHWLSPQSLLDALHTFRVCLHQPGHSSWGVGYDALDVWYQGQIPFTPTTKPVKTKRLFTR
jgi:single-stranded-DNA-specific exonuclease